MPSPQNRNWLFTINNPEFLKDSPRDWPNVKYLCWQLEKGEEGTPHYQGYVMFSKKMTLAGCKKLNSRAHWEMRKGSHDDAKNYCTKDDTRVEGPWFLGEEPATGKRNDLLACKQMIDDGASWKQVADEQFPSFVRYYRGLQIYRGLAATPRNFKTEVIVIYGPTGTGKSYFANTVFPGAYWLPNQKGSTLWWDGYQDQETVVIDEFYGWIRYAELLRICDAYPCQVQTKGGMINFAPKRIVITSNHEPISWYEFFEKDPNAQAAMMRRFEHVWYLNKKFSDPLVKSGKSCAELFPDFSFEEKIDEPKAEVILVPATPEPPMQDEQQSLRVSTPSQEDFYDYEDDQLTPPPLPKRRKLERTSAVSLSPSFDDSCINLRKSTRGMCPPDQDRRLGLADSLDLTGDFIDAATLDAAFYSSDDSDVDDITIVNTHTYVPGSWTYNSDEDFDDEF